MAVPLTYPRNRKKRFVWPFSKQHRHLRSMQKAGKSAKFGSFKYSAADLYEKRELHRLQRDWPLLTAAIVTTRYPPSKLYILA